MTERRSDNSNGVIDLGQISAEEVSINPGARIVAITEDKLKLALVERQGMLLSRDAWVAPLGILVAILLAILTTDFRKFVLEPLVWALLKRPKAKSIDDFIRQLKKTQQRDERINRLTLKAQAAMGGAAIHPFVIALVDRAGPTPEDAYLVMWNQISWWNYFLQIIPRVADCRPWGAPKFEVPIRNQYGRACVGHLYFDTYIKPLGHPDAVRYIESLLAQPAPDPH